ncbi:MAG: hypothetical protein HS099_13565 [Ardenticatenaceae bacterium]|nr:hypothetical protein [Ardenticatenaceae bacterium]
MTVNTVHPILINATPYISITIHAALKSVEIPVELSDLSEIMKQGGTDYLATLPAYDTLVEQEMNSNEAYEKLIENFSSGDIKLGLRLSRGLVVFNIKK